MTVDLQPVWIVVDGANKDEIVVDGPEPEVDGTIAVGTGIEGTEVEWTAVPLCCFIISAAKFS